MNPYTLYHGLILCLAMLISAFWLDTTIAATTDTIHNENMSSKYRWLLLIAMAILWTWFYLSTH